MNLLPADNLCASVRFPHKIRYLPIEFPKSVLKLSFHGLFQLFHLG